MKIFYVLAALIILMGGGAYVFAPPATPDYTGPKVGLKTPHQTAVSAFWFVPERTPHGVGTALYLKTKPFTPVIGVSPSTFIYDDTTREAILVGEFETDSKVRCLSEPQTPEDEDRLHERLTWSLSDKHSWEGHVGNRHMKGWRFNDQSHYYGPPILKEGVAVFCEILPEKFRVHN